MNPAPTLSPIQRMIRDFLDLNPIDRMGTMNAVLGGKEWQDEWMRFPVHEQNNLFFKKVKESDLTARLTEILNELKSAA